MPLELVPTLCDLVSLPSVNPMGRSVTGDEFYEHRMTDYLQRLFEQLGVRWQRQTLAPLRENIVARVEGDIPPERGGKIVMLEAHQDTVPVDGMTIPPWTPAVRDGRVYGRGSCDIKGGMACMLWAFARLAHERPAGMPTVIMACSVNEEHGFSGAALLSKLWTESGGSSLIPRGPDEVIVAEPTLLNVVVAHKGVARWRCHTKGRAAHSSRPHQGDNAIYHMADVLATWEGYAKSVVGGLGNHALVGTPTFSVGLISGGISVNTVPDHCVIEVDRRVLPKENSLAARQHAIDYLAQHLRPGTFVVHDEPFIVSYGLSDDHNSVVAARLGEIARHFGGGDRIGVPFGTNAPAYAITGSPTVVFGPGSIDQAHTCDEWVAIEQLEAAAEVYYQFAKSGG